MVASEAMARAPASPAPAMRAMLAAAPMDQAKIAESVAISAPERKVHYEGAIKLRATQPNAVIEQAVALARAAGGYVESLNGQRLVLQIPAARFRVLYDQILGLGEVLDKSLSARDVTEAFLDVELRLAQAKATRDRLLALIQKSSERKEKLRLLREVERLSADIELLETQMARLRTLVDYSRLTLNVEGFKAFEGRAQGELRGFEWINALAASQRRPDRDASRFALTVPTGMVELEDKSLWSATSPDGVTLDTQQRGNQPMGITAFWRQAIDWRLRERFAQVEHKTAGDFAVLRLVSRDEPRFVQWIAVAAKEQKLFIAQVYFPSLEHERRLEAAVMSSLSGGVK